MALITYLLPALSFFFSLNENVYLCFHLQPCSTENNQECKAPVELSGYRIVDMGLLQQSLQSCQHCKSGKEPTNFHYQFLECLPSVHASIKLVIKIHNQSINQTCASKVTNAH